jgi:hypothetical protein
VFESFPVTFLAGKTSEFASRGKRQRLVMERGVEIKSGKEKSF